MKRLIPLFFLFLFTQLTIGQNKGSFKDFPKGHELEWVKPFLGQLGSAKVKVSLEFDGYLCKGKLSYLKSDVIFFLDGTLKDNQIKLLQYDQKEKLVGTITGTLENDQIQAEWLNKNGDQLLPFTAGKPSGLLDNISYSAWSKLYKGKIGKKTSFLAITMDNTQQIKAKTWQESSTDMTYYDGEKTTGGFLFKNSSSEISVNNKKENKLSFTVKKGNGQLKFTSFELVANVPLQTKSFANASTSYEFTFPITKDKHFNAIILKKIEPWLNECRNTVKDKTKENSRAYSWFELTYVDDTFFSGTLYFRNTWSNDIESSTINYSFKHKDLITKKRIFKKRAKYESFIQQKLDGKLAGLNKEDKAFRQWLKHANFKFFTFGKDHLFVSTELSGLYGKETIMIPLKDMSDFLKRKNWIKPQK